MESQYDFRIDDERRIITIAGSLEQLVQAIKAIYRTKHADKDPDELNAEIDASLAEEMPHMRTYLQGSIDMEELQGRCTDLPQLTFGILHRIKFALDLEAGSGRPRIIARYFANDLPGENHFSEIRANFERALESLQ